MLNRREALGLGLSTAATSAGLTVQSQAAARQSTLDIIDTNVSLFHWPFRRLPLDEVATLTTKLRALGIVQAWAGSYEGLLHRNISQVNERLVNACGDRSLLLPIGSINPQLPGWQEDFRRCVHEHHLSGVRLYPAFHGYRLDNPHLAELLQLASQAGIFVQITVSLEDERTQHDVLRVPEVDLSPLLPLLARFNDVRIQLLNYRPNKLLEALAKSPNVFLDTARVEGTDGVPQLVLNFPSGRVLFGSHAPFWIPEAALIRIHESQQLDNVAQRAILAENARRFWNPTKLGPVDASRRPRHASERSSSAIGRQPQESEIDRLGLPSSQQLKQYRIWDSYFTPAYAHPGPDGYGKLLADIQRSLPAIVKGQFEKLCYFPHVGLGTTSDPAYEALVRSRPDLVLKPLEHHPQLLIGMIQLNANDVAASLTALDRWLKDGPMLGVYFPGSGPGSLCCASRNFYPLVERIQQLNGVIMVHTWYKTGGKQATGESTPAELAELAAKFPDQKFLCAHAGGEWEKGIRAVRNSPNILIETSGFDATAGFIELAVSELGAARIVFGSHLPSRSLGTELAKITAAQIPEDVKHKILGENYRQLLNRSN